MNAFDSEWRIVVLDCPCRSWSQDSHRQLFGDIVDLKLRAYRKAHGDTALPVDAYDYIATHLLVAQQRGDQFKPLMGFRSVSLDRCDEFRLPLPAYSHFSTANGAAHVRALDAILARCREDGVRLVHDSTWAMTNDVKLATAARLRLHELFIAILTHWHSGETDPVLLGSGVPRLRTDRFLLKVGYERVEWEGDVLPPYQQPSILNEPVVLMHLRSFSDKAREIAAKYQGAWDRRCEM